MVKQKVVAMETQYKLAARSAQLLGKEVPPDEAARIMATMTTAKSQLSKVVVIHICNSISMPSTLMTHGICIQVRERCPSLVRECRILLPLLEEMEKHITAFYQSLERASSITSAVRDPDTQIWSQQKQKWQVSNSNHTINKTRIETVCLYVWMY